MLNGVYFDNTLTRSVYYSSSAFNGGLIYRTTEGVVVSDKNGFLNDGSLLASGIIGNTRRYVQYGGSFGTGSGNSSLGSRRPGNPLNTTPATWIDVQIEGFNYCFPVWKKD